MPVTIIKTKDRAPYRPQYHALQEKYFNHPDCPYNNRDAYKGWSDSPFLISTPGIDDQGTVKAFTSLLITNQKNFDELVAGKIQDWGLKPYGEGESIAGYLFWDALILEDRHYAPYLIHSAFHEIESVMRAWKLNISHVFAIAYTKVSERLMKRYGFAQAGLYQGHYPIMSIKVTDNVYLKAFIPYLHIESSPPWAGKTAHPIPDITPKPKA